MRVCLLIKFTALEYSDSKCFINFQNFMNLNLLKLFNAGFYKEKKTKLL